MPPSLEKLIDLAQFPLHDAAFRARCRQTLADTGALVLPGFLTPYAVATVQGEGEQHRHLAYFTAGTHNIFLKPTDPQYPADHPRNRAVASSKGCITTDQIPQGSPLHTLYAAPAFREFLCAVLGEHELHAYADPLSSVNLHFAGKGQELGWHFDNSSFAVTLMIQPTEAGGVFEYVKNVRDADKGESELAGPSVATILALRVLRMVLVSFYGASIAMARESMTLVDVGPVTTDRVRDAKNP